ncbi:MAG: hypothetical protein KC964_22230 [Candidatus Omnitrophica bacterium]|nr:hypothetical protein [Candidatus Omnitrophota bacterium]
MTNTGLVIAHILVSVFLTPQKVEYKTATVEYSETLVRGVSAKTSDEWFDFLLTEGVAFSIRENGRDVYVRRNAIDLLAKAEKREALASEAKRSLKERSIERQVRAMWPQVEKPAVCFAPAEDENGRNDGFDSVIVMARNLPESEKPSLQSMIRKELSSEKEPNILILGCARKTEGMETFFRTQDQPVSVAQR